MGRFSFSFTDLGVRGERGVDSFANFSSASTSFFWFFFSSSGSFALFLVRRAVVARSDAVAVAKFVMASIVSASYPCVVTEFAEPYRMLAVFLCPTR